MNNKIYETVLREFPYPLIILNKESRVEYANKSLESMLDMTSENILMKQIADITKDWNDGGKSFLDAIDSLFKTQSQISTNQTKDHQSAAETWVQDPLNPKSLDLNKTQMNIIQSKDEFYSYEIFEIPEEKRLIILFRESSEENSVNLHMIQAEKMSALGTLAAGMAHELNNPLYSIIGFSEMLIKDSSHDKVASLAPKIIKKSRKMAEILDKLAVYARTDSKIETMTVNINERLDAALEIALLSKTSKKIKVTRNYQSLPLVRAKPDEIEQIFMNIFMNSIQAMNENGELTLTTSVEGEEAIIKIEDTGSGIPKEYITKIFDPFFTTKDQGVGTGLGLTAAYQLIKKYGGRIKIDSVANEGTTVKIHWPSWIA